MKLQTLILSSVPGIRTSVALASVSLLAALSLPALAAGEHAGHTAAHAAQAADAARLTEALVKKVDKPAGKLTLSHGPLPNGMPAMTMAFRVKDRAWLDRLKAGDKIRFEAEQIDGVMTVVRLERA